MIEIESMKNDIKMFSKIPFPLSKLQVLVKENVR